MGKVQELLSKLSVTVRPTAALAEKLCIPFEPAPYDPLKTDSGLPPDAASVKKWIIACDISNSADNRRTNSKPISRQRENTHNTLLRALQHTNRTCCTPTVRMQIMQEYEKPFTRAMQSLDTRCLYLDFPLPADAENAFQLAATLCQEMAYGYKIAIADSLKPTAKKDGQVALANTNKDSHNTGRDKSFTTNHRSLAISQAGKHLTHLALRHAQINHDWPTELWKDFYALVSIATRDRTVNNPVQSNVTGLQQLTIQQQFACLCAFYILDQKKLQAEEVRSLLVKLTNHANLLSLYSSQKSTLNSTDTYCVSENSAPTLHKFRLPQAGEELIYFSLDAVVEKLKIEDEFTGSNYQYQRQGRTELRTGRRVTITAAIGLDEIHRQIKSAPPKEDFEAQFTDLSVLLPEKSVELDSTPNAELLQQSSHPIAALSAEASFEVENQSANGLGLKWLGDASLTAATAQAASTAQAAKIQVGSLFAHHYTNMKNEVSWHVAVIKWMRTDFDESLRFGVESLSRHTNSVDVVRWINPQHQSEDSIKGLLINYQPIDSKATMLILPRAKYKTGETVGYRDEGGFHMVKLIESVAIHGSYQCFATQEIEESTRKRDDPKIEEYSIAV